MRDLYIKVENIILILSFYVGFVRFPYSALYNSIKIFMAGIIFIYAIFNLKHIKKEYYFLDTLLFIWGTWIIISGFINNNNVVSISPFRGSIHFFLVLLGVFIDMQVIKEQQGTSYIIKVYTFCALVLAAIVDFQVITNIGVIRPSGTLIYLVGSKFAVMYLHIILGALLLLFFEDINKTKRILILYYCFVIIIALRVDCVTGIVGSTFMLIVIGVIERFPEKATKSFVALLAELLAFSYVYIGVYIMSNPFVLNIIENYMGGAGTMQARVQIFESVLDLIPLSPIWGFGYATSWELGLRLGGFGDTQNSLLEWVWQAGIPSAVMICIIIIVAFRIVHQNYIKSKTVCVYSLALFYTYVFLGSIEILMELPFFSVLSLAVILSDKISVNEENENV